MHWFFYLIYNCSKNLFSLSSVAMVTSFPTSTGQYKLLVYVRTLVLHLAQNNLHNNGTLLGKICQVNEATILISIIYSFHSYSFIYMETL